MDPPRWASPTMVGSPSYCSDPLSPPFLVATDTGLGHFLRFRPKPLRIFSTAVDACGFIASGLQHLGGPAPPCNPDVGVERASQRSSRLPSNPATDGARCQLPGDRKSTRLNSSHLGISYAV